VLDLSTGIKDQQPGLSRIGCKYVAARVNGKIGFGRRVAGSPAGNSQLLQKSHPRIEPLDAAVPGIRDKNLARFRVDGYSHRFVEASWNGAAPTGLPQELPAQAKTQNAPVAGVRCQQRVAQGDRQPARAVEQARISICSGHASQSSPFPEQSPFGIECLDAGIPRIGDENPPVTRDGHSPGLEKLAVPQLLRSAAVFVCASAGAPFLQSAPASEHTHRPARSAQHDDPVIPCVRDSDRAFLGHGKPAG